MPGPGQRPSPAELASLEHAFATDPTSDTYRPLAEAYLAMGRHMEAMVVAKRGIKSHPGDPAPRVLLARVYADQRKDEKGVEVLGEALQLSPSDPAALRLLATIQFRTGDRGAAVASLTRARAAAPQDEQIAALASEHGVSFEEPAPAAPAEARPLPASASTETAVAPPSGVAQPEAPGFGSAPAAIPTAAPARSAEPRRPTAAAAFSEDDHDEPVRRSRRPVLITGVLVLVLAVLLAGWGIASGVKKRRAVEIDQLLRQTRDLVDRDAFASYREAARLCERILERDRDAIGGHAYLAYIDAIRWGELGDGDALRGEAERQVEAVKKLGRPHSHVYASQAYLKAYGGDPRAAMAELQDVLKGPEGASPLVRGALGVVALQAGDLDAARDALTTARQQAPGDVRVTQMLAEQFRRRGAGFEAQATALYDAVLTRLQPTHVPSLLGKAQLLLDANQPQEALKLIGRVIDQGQAVAPRQQATSNELRERAQAMVRR